MIVKGNVDGEVELTGTKSGTCNLAWQMQPSSGGYEIRISPSKSDKTIVARLDKLSEAYKFDAEAGETYTAQIILLDRALQPGEKARKLLPLKPLVKNGKHPQLSRLKMITLMLLSSLKAPVKLLTQSTLNLSSLTNLRRL